MTQDPPRDASLPAGYDEEDPYAEVDLSAFPDWWRRNVEEFSEFGMRPYRPPVLADGTVLPQLLADLESEHEVDITLRTVDSKGHEWALVVDDRPVRRVDHERDGGGYTVYDIDAETLTSAVETTATE